MLGRPAFPSGSWFSEVFVTIWRFVYYFSDGLITNAREHDENVLDASEDSLALFSLILCQEQRIA